ncbi:hypothetical protein Fot_42493 [Forsythia ovata]|uniref:Uncharacterized protein n=1 Tax=Forsythia ovata TaxID=205694 RepID=A0ABD1RLB9_9LAMI
MVALGGAKGNFPRQNNQGRHTGPRIQNHKVDVNEVTITRSKTINEVSAPHPRSKFCRIHRLDNHNMEEYLEVRATVDKMVENRYKPSGGSQMGQTSQPRTMNYTYHRGRGRGTRGGSYCLDPCTPP